MNRRDRNQRRSWFLQLSDAEKLKRYGPSMKPGRVKTTKTDVEAPKERSIADYYREQR